MVVGSSFAWCVRIASATASSFSSGKTPSCQKFNALPDGVWNVIPTGKLLNILRTMPGKNSKVMHPRRRKQHIIVVIHVLADRFRESIESWLMTEFVFGLRLAADIVHDRFPPIAPRHALFPGQRGVMRIRSSPPMSRIAKTGDVAGTATIPRGGRSTSPKLGLDTRPVPSAANR